MTRHGVAGREVPSPRKVATRRSRRSSTAQAGPCGTLAVPPAVRMIGAFARLDAERPISSLHDEMSEDIVGAAVRN